MILNALRSKSSLGFLESEFLPPEREQRDLHIENVADEGQERVDGLLNA